MRVAGLAAELLLLLEPWAAVGAAEPPLREAVPACVPLEANIAAITSAPLLPDGVVPEPEMVHDHVGEPGGNASRSKGGILFLTYHKTGHMFTEKWVQGFLWQAPYNGYLKFNVEGGDRFTDPGDPPGFERLSASSPWDGPLGPARSRRKGSGSVPRNHVRWVALPARTWPLPHVGRVVHWYRDPEALILSAHRYHKAEDGLHLTEPWRWGSCNCCCYCDREAHKVIFPSCDASCSLAELLQSVPTDLGVTVEALQLRRMVGDMLANLQRWANADHVLHLSMEHLHTDFNGTLACMQRFFGRRQLGMKLIGIARLRGLDPSAKRNRDDAHITRPTRRQNNSSSVLFRYPAWAEQLRTARAAYSRIQARQFRMYGCPIAPPSA